jgi:hypothetical protein
MELLFIAMLLGLIPSIIASRKGHNGFVWWLLGSLLFIVALPASLTLTAEPEAIHKKKVAEGRVRCPQCAEYIMREAKICPFCRQPVV